MTTYYVNNAGSDSNDGTENSPFLTLERAMLASNNSDTIFIQNIINTTNTLVISKQLNFLGSGNGGISKTGAGDVISIQNSNVTIKFLIISATATNTADAVITIDRGSSGATPPNNYTNIEISSNIINIFKYGVFVNGSNIIISSNTFNRNGGTERLTTIIVYQSNGLTIDSNTVIDTLRTQRFIYLTGSGTPGTEYFNDCNNKSGLMTISGNIANCSSTAQSLNFILQDVFIGSLSFKVFNNDVNIAIAGKFFVSYLSSNTDLNTLVNAEIHDNSINMSSTGIVLLDAPVSVTVPIETTKFYVYDNTNQTNFILRVDYSGNVNFCQQTLNVSPVDLHLSTLVQYSENITVIDVVLDGTAINAVSSDTALDVVITKVVEEEKNYCESTPVYGAMVECNITSSAPVNITFTIPKIKVNGIYRLFDRDNIIQPSGFPITLSEAYSCEVPSSVNACVIDVNAVGVAI